MSIGMGIFLSAIFIGLILLIIKTRDVWNWKKILIRFFLVLVLLCIILVSAIFVFNKIENQPKKVIAFWGINLTDKKNDIIFKKGKPNETEKDCWIYNQNKDDFYRIRFKNDDVRYIAYVCTDINDYSAFCPYINNISKMTSLERLLNKMGKDYDLENIEDGSERIYSYPKYNTFFVLKQNSVYALGIYNSKYGPLKFISNKSK